MNPFFKLILKLLSTSKINVEEDYVWLRKVRRVFSGVPKTGYRMLDVKIYAEEHNREIPVRTFLPNDQKHDEPILFFHGGGWVFGDIETYNNPCIHLAEATGRVVYSVDYRLAPEHPYPAGLDDCYRVAERLPAMLEQRGIPPFSQWIIMGDSAGANLAAGLSLRLKEEKKELPAKQVLVYPVAYWNHSDQSPFESIETYGYEYGLTSKKVQSYMEMYAPDEEDRKNKFVSPLMAEDYTGFPDTLVITAAFDPLKDEGEALGKAIRKDGNYVKIHEVENAVHGFFTYPKNAEPLVEAYQEIDIFLNKKIEKRG